MPEEPLKPVGKIMFEEPSSKPVGKITFEDSGSVSDEPYYKMLNGTQDPNNIEGALQMIKKSSRRDVTDSDLQTLKDVLINPQATEQQRKDAIGVIQGYAPEHKEGFINYETGKDYEFASRDYYIAPDKNGVLMPKALKYGEKPPKGFNVASDWGTQQDANDDSWYTDITKGLANAAVNLAKGVTATAGAIATEISGEDNKRAQSISNFLESKKFLKDEELNAQIYNPEGVEKFADLIDKKRFDFSPKALWGSFNAVTESAASFLGGAALTGNPFAGAFLSQVSDGIDAAKDAGLKDRDAASFGLLTTSLVSAIDGALGIEAKILRGASKEAGKEVFKQIAKTVEKDAEGFITEEGFKQVAKELVPKYTSFIKEAGKDLGFEMAQEAGQDFVQKSAEQVWDKLSDADKAKFGTDVTSAKSFASYVSNALNTLGAGPMAAKTARDKIKYEKQSIAAYDAVRKGGGEVAALKKNLELAKDRGELTDKELEQANFKIDAYNTYNEQTKDLNLDDKEKKDAFELSFNIEALKSEIPTNKEELDALDPIALAKIDNKKELIKGMQKQLNDMLLPKTVEKETKVGQKTAETIVKNEEKKKTTPSAADLLSRMGGIIRTTEGIIDDEEGVDETPDKAETRMKLFNAPAVEFNQKAWEKPMEVKAAVQEHLKTTPNNEMDVTIREAQNGRFTFDIGDNKNVWFAQSVKGEKDNYFKYENLPPTRIESEDRGGDAEQQNEGLKIGYYKEPAVVKRVEFQDENAKGETIIKAVLPVYNKESGKFIGFAKEHKTGKSFYSDEGKAILGKIINSNLYDEGLKEYAHIPNREVKAKPKKVEKKEPAKKVKEFDFEYSIKNAQLPNDIEAIIDKAYEIEYPVSEEDLDFAYRTKEKLQKKQEAKAEKAVKDKDAARKAALKQIKEQVDKEINEPKDKPKTLKEEREAAVKEVSKPQLKLDKPKKNLDTKVNVKVVNAKTGESITEQVELKKAVADVDRRFKILEIINDCLHGS